MFASCWHKSSQLLGLIVGMRRSMGHWRRELDERVDEIWHAKGDTLKLIYVALNVINNLTARFIWSVVDKNCKKELQWYFVNSSEAAIKSFYAVFAGKYLICLYMDPLPVPGEGLDMDKPAHNWTCRNPSACVVACLREVFV